MKMYKIADSRENFSQRPTITSLYFTDDKQAFELRFNPSDPLITNKPIKSFNIEQALTNGFFGVSRDELESRWVEIQDGGEPGWLRRLNEKPLCWVWDQGDNPKGRAVQICQYTEGLFMDTADICWKHATPVRDEDIL